MHPASGTKFLVVPLTTDIDHAGRRRVGRNVHPFESLGHERDPDRQTQPTAGLAAAQVARRVITHPGRGHQRGLVADEPGVHRIVGGAGLAEEVGALERGLRASGGARAGYFLQQAVHHKSIARVDHTLFVGQRRWLGGIKHLTLVVAHPGDQVGRDAVATVCKHRIAQRHLHGCDRTGPQRHREVGRVLVRVESEPSHPFLRALGTHQLKHADGNHVLRFGQRSPHRHGTFELAVVILRLPRLATGFPGGIEEGRVVDHGHGGQTLFERS